MKAFRIVILIMIFIFAINSNSFAYNSSTSRDKFSPDHQRITKFAIENLNYSDAVRSKLRASQGTLDTATETEDSYWNLAHHFYDPSAMYFCGTEDRSTSVYFTACAIPNARDYAISFYDLARKNNDWSSLGKALHLLQDVSVPSHVHRALAGGLHPFHALGGYGYEWWVTKHWNTDFTKDDKAGYLVKIFDIPNSSTQ